jgi:medium-chain acyl-[acyl-carrier-protein] hydrolase
MTMSRSRWLGSVRGNPRARLRLFCFPYAGGAANLFAQWWRELPEEVEVCPVELPGRWARWREEPIRDVVTVSRLFARELEALAGEPFVLYGHSLGGLLAYETTLRLREAGRPLPKALMMSGRLPPDTPLRRDLLHTLADQQFVQGIARYYEPIHPAVLSDPEGQAMFLRVVRADMEMFETYRAQPVVPLDLPIWAFAGREDGAAPPQDMDGWSRFSTHEVTVRVMEGGHFFIRDNDAFKQELANAIRRVT